MKSQIILADRGFTLIEMLVVLGLIAIIFSFGGYANIDSLQSYSFHSDTDTLVSALQHARAEAMSGICKGDMCAGGAPHGVHIDARAFTVFQGTAYGVDHTYDESLEANPRITHSGEHEVVFEVGNGNASDASIYLIDTTTGRVSTVHVGARGEISWNN